MYEQEAAAKVAVETPAKADEVEVLKLLEAADPRAVLQEFSKEKGLGFDNQDLDFYVSLFVEDLKKNPTVIEIFDL